MMVLEPGAELVRRREEVSRVSWCAHGLTAIRKKGLATFQGQLHGAVPGDYVANLYDANCNFLLQIGSFKVDRSGDGNFATKLLLSFGQGSFLDF